MRRRLAVAACLAALGASAAADGGLAGIPFYAVPPSPRKECHNVRHCVSVIGPWVAVPAGGVATYLLDCPKRHGFVGGTDARASSSSVVVWFDGQIGSPVRQSVTTGPFLLFHATTTNGRPGSFQPTIGCVRFLQPTDRPLDRVGAPRRPAARDERGRAARPAREDDHAGRGDDPAEDRALLPPRAARRKLGHARVHRSGPAAARAHRRGQDGEGRHAHLRDGRRDHGSLAAVRAAGRDPDRRDVQGDMSGLSSAHHFTFGEPWYLLALLAVPALLAFAYLIRRRRSRYAIAFTNLGLFARRRGGARPPLRRLAGLILLALALALSRPRSPGRTST